MPEEERACGLLMRRASLPKEEPATQMVTPRLRLRGQSVVPLPPSIRRPEWRRSNVQAADRSMVHPLGTASSRSPFAFSPHLQETVSETGWRRARRSSVESEDIDSYLPHPRSRTSFASSQAKSVPALKWSTQQELAAAGQALDSPSSSRLSSSRRSRHSYEWVLPETTPTTPDPISLEEEDSRHLPPGPRLSRQPRR
ncbi:hypothetical protein T492DRAFT_847953 [Pavlovales sp. CCMP2436]|nr:hypothetical protein T492DRAFT_847953 [Pavlovales sp. CCMP2436]